MKRLVLALLLSALALAQPPDFYQRALECARNGDRPGEIANLAAALEQPGLASDWRFRLRLQLASAYLYSRNHPAYQKTLEEAVRQAPTVLEPTDLRRLLALHHQEMHQRGDLAFDFLYRQLQADKIQLAEWYREQGQEEAQLYWWTAARDELQNDPRRSADHQNWGALWRVAPPAQRAWTLEQQLQRLSSLSPPEQTRARVHIAASLQGQRLDFQEVLRPALLQLQETPDSDARIYEDISRLYRDEPEQALHFLSLSLARKPSGHGYFSLAATLEEVHRPEQALATFREGLTYVLQHEPDEIDRFFYRSVRAARNLNREADLQQLRALIQEHLPGLPGSRRGSALEGLYNSYTPQQTDERTGVLTRMRAHYQRQMAECLQSQSWEAYAQAGRGLATTLGRLGDRRGARLVLEEVLTQTIPQDLRHIVESQLLNLLVHSNEDAAAMRLAEKLLADPDPRQARDGLEALVSLNIRRGQYPAALELIEKSPDKTSSSSLLHDRYRVFLKLGRWREAEQALEAWERAFPPNREASLYNHAELAEKLGRPEEARRLRVQMAPAPAPSPPIASQEPLGAVLDRLRLARPDLEALPLRSTNLAQLQSHLQKDQLLVAYLPAQDEILQVILSRSQQRYQKLPWSLSLLETQMEQDWQALARHRPVDLSQWTRKLMVPQKGRLLIAPTGGLWKLPLTALAPDVSLLSAADISRLAEQTTEPFQGGPSLAIGAPPAADLPGAQVELRKLARLWKNTRLKTGVQATPAALLQSPAPLGLLHIATHTLARPEDPLQSRIQLHGGDLLLTQLHQLKLRKDSLVVLSSCRGALPLNPGQAEPISLASVMSAAGAQTVIANLWDVDDQAAELFFDCFYRRLQAHHQVRKAFQEGLAAVRQRYPDPFYWAGFCLLGNAL
ncbi:hypothetical protein ABS71_02165 [bacterium SCN 62-11]|nr:CHAT domain-containing protein [Candidatus Eremiobacteraeota bacterium]ODT78028.1 MAG: hypothetical protein ABS71_02165 [bacterium SCN 62-11]